MFCHFIIHGSVWARTLAQTSKWLWFLRARFGTFRRSHRSQEWTRLVGSRFWLESVLWLGWKLFILTSVVNRKNTGLLAPVQSARDLTVQERSRPKSEALVGSGKRHTGPVHWFPAFNFSFCAVRAVGIGRVPAKLCSCVRVLIPIKLAQLKRERD